ncbi:MAG: hypothetical protein IPP29_01905 [Bacteroidetes bacterium]|nr:hypothetical protein [Bacteroidota bacterium]
MNSNIYKLAMPNGLSRAQRIFTASAVFCLLGFYSNAQLVNIPVTGFTNDIVASGVGPGTALSMPGTSNPTIGVDGAGFTFIDNTYKWQAANALPTCFMPASGSAPSLVTAGLTYNFQSYTSLNALTLDNNSTTYLTSPFPNTGQLTFTTPASYTRLFVLYESVVNIGPSFFVDATVKFTDSSSQTFANNTVVNWFSGTAAVTNVARAQNVTPGLGTTCPTAPNLFELPLTLSAANYGKQVAYITFTIPTSLTSGTTPDRVNYFHAMAVGGLLACSAPAAQPTLPSLTTISTSQINGSFTAATGPPSGYLVVRYPNLAAETAPVNGTTYVAGQSLGLGTVVQSSALTTFNNTGLFGGTTYDYYVYSFSTATAPCGGPIYLTAGGSIGSATTTACSGVAGGTYSVGPTGTYLTLTAALAAVNAGITGPVILELQSTYTSGGETFPITFPSNSCLGPINTLTIRPELGATALAITSANVTGTINFNGAKYVTIDGRAGGFGVSQLTIANTNAGASYAANFVGDATNNAILYCTVTSRNNSATSGTITFGTGVVTGNDNNLLDNCNITDDGSGSFPLNGIFSAGTSAAIDNAFNTVSNCNISNYYSATLSSAGIFLSATGTGNSNWSIITNRFFQTATRLYTAALASLSAITVATGSGYTITGNTIGFNSAAGTLGTYTSMIGNTVALTGTFPTSYTTTGTANATRYIAINCAFTAAGMVSNIQGNTVAGIALYTSSGATTTNGILCGINVTSGNVNIGTTISNTIGSTTGLGSLYAACTTTGGAVVGIFVSSANTVVIQNNTYGAVDASGTTATLSGATTGIDVAGAGNFLISNNTIGNATAGNIRTGFIQNGANLGAGGATLTSTTGTGLMLGVRSAMAGSDLNINNITLRNWITSSTVETCTGIISTGAMTGSILSAVINNNFLGTAATGAGAWMTYAVANSGILTGISLANTVAILHSIQNNDFRGIVHNVAGSNTMTLINLTGATATGNTATIAGNTFTNLNLNTSGSVTFMSHNYTISNSGTKNVNNNSIVTAFNKPGVGGTVTLSTTNSLSPGGAMEIETGNNFSNITLAGATTMAGWVSTDGSATPFPTKTITGNTFNNWICGTSAVTGMNVNFIGGTSTPSSVSNNTITNITGQGAITGLNIGGSGASVGLSVSTNTITGLSSTGVGGSITGISTANLSPLVTINGNIINTLSSTGASSAIIGIAVTGATLTNVNDNRITGITGTGTTTPTANGILVSGGSTVNLNRNKICDIAENGTFTTIAASVIGISMTGGTTVTAANNIIGDLRTPATTNDEAIRGISVSSAAASTSYNVYNNTVYLNASSTGTPFGTTGVFHAANATATTAKLDLRNNIIVNNSTPAGAGISSALRRSVAAILGNYAITSNNNMYYAGVPSAVNAILNDNGTVYGTAAAAFAFGPAGTAGSFQNFVTASRESASFTQVVSNTPGVFFQNLTCSSPTFLHPINGLASQIESGGQIIDAVVYAQDYDLDTRAGSTGYAGTGTAPDIGADEFNGVTPAPAITGVTITPGSSQCVAVGHLVSATLTTASGTITGAVINFNFNGTSQVPVNMTLLSGNIWTGTIPAGVPVNATVTWSIVATNSVPLSSTFIGTPYSDVPLFGAVVSASANVSAVCAGSQVSLIGITDATLFTENFETASFPLTSFALNNTAGVFTANQNTTFFTQGSSSVLLTTASLSANGNITTTANFNLTQFSSAQLSFKHIAAMEGSTSSFDFGLVEFSIDGGANWITFPQANYVGSASTAVFTGGNARFSTRSYPNWIAAFTGAASLPNNTLWQSELFNIPATALTSSQFKIRFRYTTDGSTNFFGWLIDNVIITGARNYASYSWTSTPAGFTAATQNASANPTVPTSYTFTATTAGGCSVSASTPVIGVNPLPSAPTGTPSSQCGLGIPAASVASTSGLPNPQYWWYSTPAGTTVLQTPPLSNTLSTYYTNNFTSSTLTNSSIAGAASISGGLLALQPTITSSGGSITVNASGLNNTIYQTDFDVSLIATGTTIADGFSYSIGDDAIPLSNATTPSAEKGSGSKIRIGFFTFNAANGSDGKGIYLGYGVSATSGYTAGTPGMLGYNGTNLGWIPVAAGTVTSHVTVTINAAGQLTLVVGGVTIFNNVQLPPAYLSANKSNWKHIISSRSGGIAGGYTLDNLVIQTNTYSTGSTTYLSTINAPTTFYVSEKDSITGCESTPRTPVVANVTFGDTVTAVAQVSAVNITSICTGNTFQLSTSQSGVSLNNYTYTWSANSTNSGITGSVAGGTFASPTTINVTPLAPGTYTYTVNYTDGLCAGFSTINIVVAQLPSNVTASSSGNNFCGSGTFNLSSTATSNGGSPVQVFSEPMETFPLTQFGLTNITGTYTATQNSTFFAQGASSVLFTTTSLSASAFIGTTSNINLTPYTTAQLTFKHIAAMEGPTTSFDFGFVEYSIDGGTNWITFQQTNYAGTAAATVFSGTNVRFSTRSYANWISTFTGAASLPNNTLWQTETFNVPASALTSSQFRVRFRYTNDVSTNFFGWLIDDVKLTAVTNASFSWVSSPAGFSSSLQNPTGVTATVPTTYTVTASNSFGCTSTASVLVNINVPPSAPTAPAPTTQCGYGAPLAAVTSTTGASGPIFNWYSASSGGTLLQGPPVLPLANYYSNDFTSPVLTNSSIAGAASVTSGLLILHQTGVNTGGSLIVNASGYNSNLFKTDFDLELASNGATMGDGFSLSFGDDAVALDNTTTPTAEHGSGSKLRIGFFTKNAINTSDGKGIYLMYNVSATTGYTSATPGVLAYSTNVSWVPTSATNLVRHVTLSINILGQLTLSVGGTPIFTNVQLPAGFLSSDKSTWKNVFSTSSTALAGGFDIDNLVIQNNTIIFGYNTYQNPINNTTTFYVTEIDKTTGCESTPRTPLTVNVTQPDSITVSSASTSCVGTSLPFSVSQTGSTNTYVYSWYGYPSASSGVAGVPTGPSQTFTATVPGTYYYVAIGYDAANNCTAIDTQTVIMYQGLTGSVTATQILSCVNPTGLISGKCVGSRYSG